MQASRKPYKPCNPASESSMSSLGLLLIGTYHSYMHTVLCMYYTTTTTTTTVQTQWSSVGRNYLCYLGLRLDLHRWMTTVSLSDSNGKKFPPITYLLFWIWILWSSTLCSLFMWNYVCFISLVCIELAIRCLFLSFFFLTGAAVVYALI